MVAVRFQLPIDIENVPHNAVGVYRFSLRFPSNYELGIHGSTFAPHSARRQLLETVKTFEAVRLGQALTGHISNQGVSQHLKRALQITGVPLPDVERWFDKAIPLDACTQEKIKGAAEILRPSLDGAIAIYVGMTGKQSFKARLLQHLNGQTNLMGQIKASKLSVSQLWFDCTTMDRSESKLISDLEDLTQATLKPAFSKA